MRHPQKLDKEKVPLKITFLTNARVVILGKIEVVILSKAKDLLLAFLPRTPTNFSSTPNPLVQTVDNPLPLQNPSSPDPHQSSPKPHFPPDQPKNPHTYSALLWEQ
jgi:hypothetical protein